VSAACGLLLAACSGDPAPPAVPFFGERPPGETALLFAPGTISVEGRYEFALSFSPAGDELMFTAEGPEQAATIYYSRFEKDQWAAPRELYLSEGQRSAEMEAFYTPDGKRIYFAAYDEGMDVRIWAVDRGRKGWGEPRQLGSPLSDDAAFFATATASGTVYYHNLEMGRIYRATIDGDAVESVEDAGLAFGLHPFVAPDESFLLLDGREREEAELDIFVAFRQADGRRVPAGGRKLGDARGSRPRGQHGIRRDLSDAVARRQIPVLQPL